MEGKEGAGGGGLKLKTTQYKWIDWSHCMDGSKGKEVIFITCRVVFIIMVDFDFRGDGGNHKTFC